MDELEEPSSGGLEDVKELKASGASEVVVVVAQVLVIVIQGHSLSAEVKTQERGRCWGILPEDPGAQRVPWEPEPSQIRHCLDKCPLKQPYHLV